MKKLLLVCTVFSGSLVMAKYPGVIGTPTVKVDVPTALTLPQFYKFYRQKALAAGRESELNKEDYATCKLLDALAKRTVRVIFTKETFHLEYPWKLAGISKDVNPDVINMVLNSLEYDEYGVIVPRAEALRSELEASIHDVLKNRNFWDTDCTATITVRWFLDGQRIRMAQRPSRQKAAQEQEAALFARKELAAYEAATIG